MPGVSEATPGSPQDPLVADNGGPRIDFVGSWEALGCSAAPDPLSGRRWSDPEQQLDSGQFALAVGAWQWPPMAGGGFLFCSLLFERAAMALESGFPSPAAFD